MKPSYRSLSVLFSCTLFFLYCLFSTSAAGAEEYHYQEQKGKEIIPFTWKIENNGANVRISVFKGGNSYISTCSGDGATHEWQLTEIGKGNVEAKREGTLLHINGRRSGELYENVAGLNDLHWLQPLYYSLSKFVNSTYRNISFWTIREGEIVPILLNARKRGVESISVNGNMVQALKIEVSSDDFMLQFWRGLYWFREGDNLLVMYRSKPGIVGFQDTVVTLMDIK